MICHYIGFIQKFLLAIALFGVGGCSTALQSSHKRDQRLSPSSVPVLIPSECDAEINLTTIPARGLPGSVLVVTARPMTPSLSLQGEAILGQERAAFFRAETEAKQGYIAVLAIPYSQQVGETSIEVRIDVPGRAPSLHKVPIIIEDEVHPVEKIRVSKKFTAKSRGRGRPAAALGLTTSPIYRHTTPRKLWHGYFHLPIENAEVTSPFGASRTFNGRLHAFHGGVDLRAPIGTSVRASASGIVVLSKRLFETGNTVIIDHGLGIFTVYAHLSSRNVKAGEEVTHETLIGCSGRTGRARGPHLHWGAVIHGIKVDSLGLVFALGAPSVAKESMLKSRSLMNQREASE